MNLYLFRIQFINKNWQEVLASCERDAIILAQAKQINAGEPIEVIHTQRVNKD